MPDASIPAVAEEIAIRVVAELIEEIDITNDDPFATALDAIRQSLVKSPTRTGRDRESRPQEDCQD